MAARMIEHIDLALDGVDVHLLRAALDREEPTEGSPATGSATALDTPTSPSPWPCVSWPMRIASSFRWRTFWRSARRRRRLEALPVFCAIAQPFIPPT